jgi:ATP-dependent DNA helicase RecG
MSIGALKVMPTREDDTEERKESWSDECLKALAALANTRGGTLWIGIDDAGHPVLPGGWTGGDKDETRISNQIVGALQSHPSSMTVETVEGLPALAIRMARSPVPVSVRGRYYRRVGNSTHEVPHEELPRFLLERTGQSWDFLPAEAGIDALSAEAMENFRAFARNRLPNLSPADTMESILVKLRLTQNGGTLRRGAILLFGTDPQRFVPSALVQVGLFQDGDIILDEQRVEGNLFQQLEQTLQALRKYILARLDIPESATEGESSIGSLQREEVWEFPYQAVREAVLNALIHRDYTSAGRVQIRVYEDRLIITNPGGLPEGLSIVDLLSDPHSSVPRNPLLGQVCYYAGLVEQWGTGTIRMRNACRTQGVPDPAFTSAGGSFAVTLYKDALSPSQLQRRSLSARQIQAVAHARQNGSITNRDYRKMTGLSDETARQDLKDLVKKGVLVPEGGGGRSSRYVIGR